MDYEDLLESSGCKDGDERRLAERDLEAAEQRGLLQIVRHRRTALCQQVRVVPEKEQELFALVGLAAPSVVRAELRMLIENAKGLSVPENRRTQWASYFERLIEDVAAGRSIAPFDRGNIPEIREMLHLLAALLSWKGESLTRFASSLLCGNSKRLEELQPRLEASLSGITDEAITSFVDLGILPNERSIWLHGPLKLILPDGEVNLGLLRGPTRLSLSDLICAKVVTEAQRFLTVENQAMFHELCKLRSGAILASSGSEGGFAHSAIIHFLGQVPSEIECWHFGDSDAKGFEILANLRERSGRRIGPLHMGYRPDPTSARLTKDDLNSINRMCASKFLIDSEKEELKSMRKCGKKGLFEQESLGRPFHSWPFYASNLKNL
jgi:hypothetical protein